MKRFAIIFSLLACAAPLRAQKTAANPLGGNLTVQDAGTCLTTGSFLWQQLPSNASTTIVNLAGTFSGTLTIRVSTNGGGSWTTNATTTSAGNTSVATNGFTDICADVTTFTSGSFAVTISTGLNTGPQGPVGPAGSGSVSVVGLPLGNTIYESTACPANTPGCFQVFNDVHGSVNASYTNTSQSVSTASTDPAFVAGDVGKIEFGAGNCPGTISNCTYQVPQGTITAVNSAHNVTVSIAATGTSSATANANNFFWGHDDGAQHVAAFAALFPNSFTGNLIPEPSKSLQLACGLSFTSVPPFITSATTSSNGGGLNGCGGGGSTVIIPLPKMNCQTTGGGGLPSSGCLFSDVNFNLENQGTNLPGWHVRDITFWGGGTDVKDAAATYSTPAAGIWTQFTDVLDDVWVVGWVWHNSTAVYGIANSGGTMIGSGSVAGGSFACFLQGLVGVIGLMHGGSCGGSESASLTIAQSNSMAETIGVYINQAFTGTGTVNSSTTNGIWADFGSHITVSHTNSGAGAITYFNGTILDQFGGGSSALTISNGIVHLNNVHFIASGAPINQTGGTIFDNCGNGVIPGTAPVATNQYGDCSITGVADVAGNHVLNASWGTTATVTAVGGSTTAVTFTINSAGTGQAASPTITDTFAVPFWKTPNSNCSILQIGGTFGVITNPVPSSLSRTGVTWTFSGTPVATQSYIFQRTCRNS